MGTLVAVPLALGLKNLGVVEFWGALVFAFILGIGICGEVSRKLGVHDHGGIVWDEIVGYWLSVAFVPLQWNWLLAAFVLFRCFDIFKPWPVSWADANIKGGLGVMVDDVLAAAYAAAVLYAAAHWI